MCQPLEATLGIFGRHMKVACRPLRRQISFTAVRKNTMLSAVARPIVGAKVNSSWLGPNSTSIERSGRPRPWMFARRISTIGSTRS